MIEATENSMKLSVVRIVILIAVTISSTASQFLQSTSAAPRPGSERVTIPGSPAAICSKPDLVPEKIQLELISRTSPHRGRVRITGIVRNVGSKTFISNPALRNRSYVALQELTTARKLLVGQQYFQNLRPGQDVKVVFEKDWDTRASALPSKYVLLIAANADYGCQPHSFDSLQRSSTDINALFSP
jgi:hypothetical protein